jgi:hypothetical protein
MGKVSSVYVRAVAFAYAHPWVLALVTGAVVGSLPFIDPKRHHTFGSRVSTGVGILIGVTLVMRLMFYLSPGGRHEARPSVREAVA